MKQILKFFLKKELKTFCINSLYSGIIFTLYLSLVYIHIIIQAQVNGMIGHCVKTDMHQCRQGLKVARHYLSRHLKHTQQTPQYSIKRDRINR